MTAPLRPAPTLESLGAPAGLGDCARQVRGMIIVAADDCGLASAVFAALLHHASNTRAGRIVTVEKPIRYEILHATCTVAQREVGSDIREAPDAFHKGIRHALRVDADIVGIDPLAPGHMETAFQATESGLLVIGTLAAKNPVAALETIVRGFGPDRDKLARDYLTKNLIAIASAVDARGTDGELITEHELLVATDPVRDAIRRARLDEVGALLENAPTRSASD